MTTYLHDMHLLPLECFELDHLSTHIDWDGSAWDGVTRMNRH